jgi:tRNA(Arg) A34 adenosine deaminase TadA
LVAAKAFMAAASAASSTPATDPVVAIGGRDKDFDVKIMQEAMKEANIALYRREVPVGCIVVDESGTVVCRKRNRPNETYNPTAHAEMLAVDEMIRESASRQAALARFRRCTLYVTVEPCVMCAAALARVGMGCVVFGARNEKFGGCGTAIDVASGQHCPQSWRQHSLVNTGGVLQDEAVRLLREFYSRGNVRAPRPQRPVPPEWRAASMARAPPRMKNGGGGGTASKRSRESTSAGAEPKPSSSSSSSSSEPASMLADDAAESDAESKRERHAELSSTTR